MSKGLSSQRETKWNKKASVSCIGNSSWLGWQRSEGRSKWGAQRTIHEVKEKLERERGCERTRKKACCQQSELFEFKVCKVDLVQMMTRSQVWPWRLFAKINGGKVITLNSVAHFNTSLLDEFSLRTSKSLNFVIRCQNAKGKTLPVLKGFSEWGVLISGGWVTTGKSRDC